MSEHRRAESGGVGRASALLAAGTMVSRLLGFVSAFALAMVLGTVGAGADLFTIANQLPNNIYAIIAGGVLTAVLVPQIVRAGSHSDGGAGYINRLVTLGLVIFLIVALLATLCAPLLVALYAQQGDGAGRGLDAEEFALASAFAYWCMPQVLFYAIYSLLGEVLNARRVFGPFTWAPALNNVVAILGIIAFGLIFGAAPAHSSVGSWAPERVALIAGSATLGVAAQAVILFAFWRRAGLRYRPDFRWRGVGLGKTGRAAAWIFGMVIITQLAGLVQSNVASLAAGTGEASVTVLKYAWLIFMLPHSIITVSIGTAYFTRMAGHAHQMRMRELTDDVSSALRSIGVLMTFAAGSLIVLSFPFAAVFGGDFENISAMASVLIAYLIGLVPFSALFVLQRTFYSVEDTRTPFLTTLFQSVLFVVGALVVTSLPTDRIALGVAVVMTIAGMSQTALSAALLRRRLGTLDGRHLVRQYVVFFSAMVPAAMVGAVVVGLLGGYTRGGYALSGFLPAVLTMAAAGTAMLGVYIGILWLVRNPELRAVLSPLQRRLRRGS